jgi:hypothetical protein
MSLAISAAGLTIEPLPSSELAIRLCSPTRNRGALRLTLARGVEARAFRETSLEAAEVDRLAVAERDMEVERRERAVREAMMGIKKGITERRECSFPRGIRESGASISGAVPSELMEYLFPLNPGTWPRDVPPRPALLDSYWQTAVQQRQVT